MASTTTALVLFLVFSFCTNLRAIEISAQNRVQISDLSVNGTIWSTLLEQISKLQISVDSLNDRLNFEKICTEEKGGVILGKDCFFNPINERLKWIEGEQLCVSLGGHLGYIFSAEEQLAIETWRNTSEYLMHNRFFIGMQDYEKEGYWYWNALPDVPVWLGVYDGNSPQGLYTNWREGEPNNVNAGDCGELFELALDYQWDDTSCDRLLPAFCRVPLLLLFPTTAPSL
eukprot:GCRY01001023.1.p1 GENE.GCRY01001023.1~~GCRY01001023.1.p1  ORF type:complete len:229 (+),score=19.67 GCRY01001023.1:52-738(+)